MQHVALNINVLTTPNASPPVQMAMRKNTPALLRRWVSPPTELQLPHNLIPRRHFISLWKHLRQVPEPAEGLTQLLHYRKFGAFPVLQKQKIFLRDGEKQLGIMDMAQVMRDHVRPGKMLSFCGSRKQPLHTLSPHVEDSESAVRDPAALLGVNLGHKPSAAPDLATTDDHYHADHTLPSSIIQDYEIVSIDFESYSPTTGDLGATITAEEYRTTKIHLKTMKMRHRELKHALSRAYHRLSPESAASQYPVEFHLRTPTHNNVKKAEYSIQQYVGPNRFDLHPQVIMRAMPRDSLKVLGPLISHNGEDLVWLAVSRDYSLGSWRGSRLARELEHILMGRWQRLKHLIDMGRLSVNER